MRTIAVIQVDLDVSPIGTKSRLAEDLGGCPVLARTIQRVRAAQKLDDIILVCSSNQADAVRRLVDQNGVTLKTFDGPDYPPRRIACYARKWSLNSWRGGLGNTCFFDEHTHAALCASAARDLNADAVVSIAAEAPVVDPRLIDAMVGHYEETESARVVFAQTPPGLSPAVFESGILAELSRAGMAPSWPNAYRPDKPAPDMSWKSNCYRVPLSIQYTSGRFTTDTRRGFEMLAQILPHLGADAEAAEICERAQAIRRHDAEPLPREIHIELTTQDQLSRTILRPRGQIVGQRAPLSRQLLAKAVQEVSAYDDALVVLGGFGEPLLHPDFEEFLGICHDAGVFGMAVRTNGIDLTERKIEALIDAEVDVIQVLVDAASAEQYRRLHGCDAFEAVTHNIDRLNEIRQSRQRPTPLVFSSMVKAQETLGSMEAFYDHWVGKGGWAVVEGYSHHAGMLTDRQVMSMAPPQRLPCRQLNTRCTILSNGDVVGCDQDFKGLYVLGNLAEQSLAEIWQGERINALREAHRRGDYAMHPMCSKCDEWHRP